MASIVRRTTSKGEKRLYVKYRAGDGKQHWELIPTGLAKDANARKAEVEIELRRSGGHWTPPVPVRFDSYADGWLERHKPNLRPRVYVNYETSVRLHLKPAFEHMELAAISPVEVKTLVASMRKEEKSVATIKNAIGPLRQILVSAVEDRLIPANPLSGVRLFGSKPQAARKIVPPTRKQVDAIIAKARVEARDAIVVAAATGARRGELFGLRWADVDFTENLIHVHCQNFAGEITEATKSEAGERDLPLFASIRQLLLERKARMRYSRPQDFVFGSTIGTPMDPNNFVRREFKTALTAAKLEGFRWHDLRHYAVSALIAEGANILLIAKVAGHSDPSVTLSVYSHLMPAGLTEAAEKFDPMRAKVAAAG
jgi:integrase